MERGARVNADPDPESRPRPVRVARQADPRSSAGVDASTAAAPSGRTRKTVWHLEQRTFAPRGPIFSSATLNLAWHWLQTTIIGVPWASALPRTGHGQRDYTCARLTQSAAV